MGSGRLVRHRRSSAESLDLAALRRSVNGLCGPDVVVRDVELAEDDFDARFSAMSRTYRYTVLNRAVPDPFLAATTWHVSTPLDLAGMRLACDPFIGEHDFSSFCQRRWPDQTPRCAPCSPLQWDDLGDDLLRFEITANAFCQQMVRAIVGTLVEVGQGRKHAGHIAAILRARDRAFAGGLAPPHGLLLWRVDYPEPVPGWDLPPAPDFVERVLRVSLSPRGWQASPSTPRVVRLCGPRGPSVTPAREKVVSCARTHRRPARSSATGTSSTRTGSSSAGCAPRSPACCAASTSRSSPRTSTPATS